MWVNGCVRDHSLHVHIFSHHEVRVGFDCSDAACVCLCDMAVILAQGRVASSKQSQLLRLFLRGKHDTLCDRHLLVIPPRLETQLYIISRQRWPRQRLIALDDRWNNHLKDTVISFKLINNLMSVITDGLQSLLTWFAMVVFIPPLCYFVPFTTFDGLFGGQPLTRSLCIIGCHTKQMALLKIFKKKWTPHTLPQKVGVWLAVCCWILFWCNIWSPLRCNEAFKKI